MPTVAIDANSYLMLPSVEAAVDYSRWLAVNRLADSTAWVMGGQEIYRAAVAIPACGSVHLTRVFACQLTADRFFPLEQLEEKFHLESAQEPIEEQGVRYRFEVYRRRE